MYCWKCGEAFETKEKIQRKDTCPKCDSDLRCCYNCEFYDKEAYHQCKEPQAEWVRYKERGNFCDYFRPRRAFFRKGSGPEDAAENKKKKWDSLFKDESEDS
jgi:hypothetical protein